LRTPQSSGLFTRKKLAAFYAATLTRLRLRFHEASQVGEVLCLDLIGFGLPWVAGATTSASVTPPLSVRPEASKQIRRNKSAKHYGKIPSISR
jgi:hypothetical protein